MISSEGSGGTVVRIHGEQRSSERCGYCHSSPPFSSVSFGLSADTMLPSVYDQLINIGTAENMRVRNDR